MDWLRTVNPSIDWAAYTVKVEQGGLEVECTAEPVSGSVKVELCSV